MISFCITCMDWLDYLKHTLPANIEVSDWLYPDVEFVLLDYNSKDGVGDWVSKNFRRYLDNGMLKYYRTTKPQYFHRSHAKNVAHKLSKGEIVCNLDADNFLSVEFLEAVIRIFKENDKTLIFGDSQCRGRIGLKREYFFELGGYNEDFKSWGVEDCDFLLRASLHLKLMPLNLKDFCWAIDHDYMERVKNQRNKNLLEAREENVILAKDALARNHYVANQNREWGILY